MSRAGGGVRLAVLEEPNRDEHINVGMLKHLTGCDTINARDLYQKGSDAKEIDLWFKVIIICNELPPIPHMDMAMFRRLRVIRFKSLFVRPDDANPAPALLDDQKRERRFPMDVNFAAQIPLLAPAFAWLLLERRKNLAMMSLPPPREVVEDNERYRSQNDVFAQFVGLRTVRNDAATLTVTAMYEAFKANFVQEHGGLAPKMHEFRVSISKLWGHEIHQPGEAHYWAGHELVAVMV
jgi:putative DNA primase/helicase